MATRRVVIVGAGVLGLSCASELCDDPDLRVTVLDRRYPGSGSTGLSAGVYTRTYLNADDIELRVASVKRLMAHAEAGIATLRRIGVLRLARDATVTARYREAAAVQRSLGVEDATVLEPDELTRLVPDFDADGVVAALYCPSDGYLDGAELCAGLAERVQAAGVELVVRGALQGLRRQSAGGYELVTTHGDIAADVIVNCTGAWAQHVGELLEAPVRVVNERHEAYVFALPEDVAGTIPMTLDNVPGDGQEGLYFRQEGERQLVVGLHANEILGEEQTAPDDCYAGATQDRVELVVERLAAAFPHLDGIGYQSGWAGMYPHSPDGRPYAGPHPGNPDILIGGGLGGVGLSVAPHLGSVLADWIRHGEPRSPIGAGFDPSPAVTAPGSRA